MFKEGAKDQIPEDTSPVALNNTAEYGGFLHGDTLINCSRNHMIYVKGIPIKELAGKEFVIPTVNETTGQVVHRRAKVLYSGKAPCIEIRLARPKAGTHCRETEHDTLICTPKHLVFMSEPLHVYKQADLLQVGDRLQTAQGLSYLCKASDSLKSTKHSDEYRVKLKSEWNGHKNVKITSEHRLIAKAWFGDIPEGFVVYHKDGNRLNNDVENLELIPQKLLQRVVADYKMSQPTPTPERILYLDTTAKWRNKRWLELQLQAKSVAQVAYEQGVAINTLQLYINEFKLTPSRIEDPYYTEEMVNVAVQKKKWKQGNKEARIPPLLPLILTKVAEEVQLENEAKERKRLNQQGKLLIKTGAWTVESPIQSYEDGQPQDVYAVIVDADTESDLYHNFSTPSIQIADSSPSHPLPKTV